MARVFALTLVTFALVLLFGQDARAFTSPSQFLAPEGLPNASTLTASGDGVYFTGSPRFAGLACSACHLGGDDRLGVRVGAEPSTLFRDGYEPGKTYVLEVTLTNESRGLGYSTERCTEPPGPKDTYTFVPCNKNGFALEIASDQSRLGQGQFCAKPPSADGLCPPPDPFLDEVLATATGDAVFSSPQHDPNDSRVVLRNGATSWQFYWTAPASDVGPVTIHVAAVDGNGGQGTAANDADPNGDGTVVGAVALGPRAGASSGCSSARDPGGGSGALVLLSVAIMVLSKRSRNRCRRSS